jgi:hypothetical protein
MAKDSTTEAAFKRKRRKEELDRKRKKLNQYI